MEIDSDIIIIGAGPAGLTAARYLAEQDIEFQLLMKENSPCVEKTCGGFIPRKCLNDFHINLSNDFQEISAIRMKFPGMDLTRVDFDKPIGVNTTRAKLGNAMLDLIPGIEGYLRTESRVNRISLENDMAAVDFRTPEGREKLRTKLVIDASGANSIGIRSGLVRQRIPNSGMGYGVQYQLNIPGKLDSVNDFYYGHEYSPGGYAWNFPRTGETVVGTGGLVERVKSDDKRVFDYLDNLIRNTEPISSELKAFQIIKKEAALMPLAGIVTPSFANRILLVGDAAGHCSPISGEGIFYAMLAGRIAAKTAIESLQKKDQSSHFLERYEKRWKSAFGSDLKWGAWLQKRLTSSKSGSAQMGASFLKSEKSQRIIAEMLAGERSVRSAIVAAAPRYIKSKISK